MRPRYVLRIKKGEAGYKPFGYKGVWAVGISIVGFLFSIALISSFFTAVFGDAQKNKEETLKRNQCATVFNELTAEQRESLSPYLSLTPNEQGLIDLEPEENGESATTKYAEWANSGWVLLVLLAIFSFAVFFGYASFFNYEEEIRNGKEYLVPARDANGEIRYFMADFPDGRSKWPLIIVTIPFWPVYLVSWLRMRAFKKQIIKTES